MYEFLTSTANVRIALFTIVTCLLACVWLYRRSQSSQRPLPPGPWRIPLVGCVMQVVGGLMRSKLPIYEYLTMLKGRYGSVYCLDICGQKVVVLNSYKAMVEAFNNPFLSDRPKASDKFGKAVQRIQHGIVFSNGDLWTQQRKLTHTTLRSFGVGKHLFADKVSEEVAYLLDEFYKTKGQEFDPKLLLINATSNVICSVVFGHRFDYKDESFQRLLYMVSEQLNIVVTLSGYFILPILKYLPNALKISERFESNSVELIKFTSKMIQDHKHEFDPENLTDFTDVYLNEIRLKEEGKSRFDLLTEDSLRATIGQLFGAGSDSTALNIRWMLFYLITNPTVQKRVHKELDTVVGRNRLPNSTDKNGLPYLQAVILESMRVATTGRFSSIHAASADTTLCGYHIPKGSIVLGNVWAVHYDSETFKDPYTFDPERFLKEGKFVPADEVIPFGVGRRFCVGDNLAKMEIFIVLSQLLHQFTFTADKSMTDVGTERLPKQALKIRAIPRD